MKKIQTEQIWNEFEIEINNLIEVTNTFNEIGRAHV